MTPVIADAVNLTKQGLLLTVLHPDLFSGRRTGEMGGLVGDTMTRPNTQWCSRMACSHLERRRYTMSNVGKVRRQSICGLTGRQPGNMCYCPMEKEEDIERERV